MNNQTVISEIEEVAMMHSKVLEAGCIGVKNSEGQEEVKLHVSPKEGEASPEETADVLNRNDDTEKENNDETDN